MHITKTKQEKKKKRIKFNLILSEEEVIELLNGGGYWLKEKDIRKLARLTK